MGSLIDKNHRMKWYRFDPAKGSRQKLPPERRYVLVMCPGYEMAGVASQVCVGWLKYAAGDRQSPYFVTPGPWVNHRRYDRPKPAYAWCDCLGDDFFAPLWLAGQNDKVRLPADIDEVNA